MKNLEANEGGESAQRFRLQEDTLIHPHLVAAKKEIEAAIFGSNDISVIQVVGCSGVGKSHLIRSMLSDLFEEYKTEMDRDPAFLPVNAFIAPKPSDRAFSWGGFYEAYLTAFQHGEPKSKDLTLARTKIANVHNTRRTKAVFIDEAHHITEAKDEESVRSQSEVIKSLTQQTQAKLVLVGTFDLLPLIRLNGQTARRSRVVHFRRYDGSEAPKQNFLMVLKALQKHWSHVLGFELAQYHDDIFEHTLGLVGQLRTWLDQAQAFSHRDAKGNKKDSHYDAIITEAAFDEARPKPKDLLPLISEARLGEHHLRETDAAKTTLTKLLYGDPMAITELLMKDESGQGKRRKRARRGGNNGRGLIGLEGFFEKRGT